jgi:hypothetical protein
MIIPSDLADACEGHFPGDMPAVLPHSVRPDPDAPSSLRAEYRCPCGREWTCWWDAESAGWPLDRRSAA